MRNWLRGPRGGLIVFLLIAGLVGGGLGWMTAAVLRLEREQQRSRAEAELASNLRLALWRLDGLGQRLGGEYRVLVEQIQQPLGVHDDAAFERLPVAARDGLVEHADVEVVLHVHRHGVEHPSVARHQAPFRRMTVLTVSKTM